MVGRPHKGDDGEARSRILEAAVYSFAETGISASSIKGISQKAGCTPALIHYHFKDKETLVHEALETHVLPVMLRFWQTAELGLGARDMLLEMVSRIRKAARETPWFLSIWSRELASDGGYLRSFLRGRLALFKTSRFKEAIRAGQKDGTINPSLAPELVYVSLISAACVPALSLKAWETAFGKKISGEELERHILGMVTRGLGGDGERSDNEPAEPEGGGQRGRGRGAGRGKALRRTGRAAPGRAAPGRRPPRRPVGRGKRR
jgi:AcrR family transcriptional regulator